MANGAIPITPDDLIKMAANLRGNNGPDAPKNDLVTPKAPRKAKLTQDTVNDLAITILGCLKGHSTAEKRRVLRRGMEMLD